jgi:hypothetical protein
MIRNIIPNRKSIQERRLKGVEGWYTHFFVTSPVGGARKGWWRVGRDTWWSSDRVGYILEVLPPLE